ncbi:MAG: FAD-binding protein [Bacteroidales bacterium]|nr:FAD-binding protein [Bacteroidales bacterium]
MMKFDVVIIGGGLAGVTAATALQESGCRCVMVAEGLSLHEAPRNAFRAAGGTVLAGDRVCGGTVSGGKLLSVSTEKLGDVSLEAPYFILATGKFFSRGIVADMDGVREPLFGLDVEYVNDRSSWFSPSFSDPQPFMEFGVKAEDGCALIGGQKIVNLFPAGEVLAGISILAPDAVDRIKRSALDAAALITG